MTLIVGIKCSEGIVLGADGAATFGALGRQTIRQTIHKLQVIEKRVVVGVSGPIGLSQRFTSEVETIWEKKQLSGKKPPDAMALISERLRLHIFPEIKAATAAQPLLGGVAHLSALSQTVVAIPVSKEVCLFQFDQQGAPECASKDLPFVAIGSGQSIADPFMAFVRRIFWPTSEPTLSDGVFAVLWCLQHAIQTNPGGVADPKQIVVMKKDDKADWAAREWSPEEFEEHLEAIQAAEDSLKKFKEGFQKEAPPVPLPEK